MRTRNSALTLAVAAGFLFGALMLGPDLDTRSIHYRRWGVFRWIWIPYRGSMKHRSPLSHWPLVGTVVRVLYVLAWFLLLSLGSLAFVNEVFQLGWTWNDMGSLVQQSLRRHQATWWAVAVGLELGALSHYLADWGVSTYKRVRRQYPKEGWRSLRLIVQSPSQKGRKKKRRSPPSRSSAQRRSPSRTPKR